MNYDFLCWFGIHKYNVKANRRYTLKTCSRCGHQHYIIGAQ